MERINKLFTIGQFAALHGINKKTLMWYDEIGLFRPAAINPENGYRYYDYHQSPVLETILLLRAGNSRHTVPKRYQEIFDYAREHGLTPYGYSYEMGINENVIERIEDYIVQIEIPITLHPVITQESSRRFG